ncbi:MAG: hypothetical protein ABSG59_15090 [Verrucomicrobiota bacterium]|jgi:hypothetical protein
MRWLKSISYYAMVEGVMRLIALFLLLAGSASAMDRLNALSMLESGENDHMIGASGEVSRYQVRISVWKSVTASRQFTRPEVARFVASTVMEKRVHAFTAAYGRPPTDFEYYALWNAPAQIMSHNVSRVVADRCRRFSNLCAVQSTALAMNK